MSLSDPIGDMIARVKNAQSRNHKKVELPSSNFKVKIADILKNEGFIKDFKINSVNNKPVLSLEERFEAQQKLSKLPRNSARIRVMNRCQITGRPHGVYRKLKISRIALRQLGLQGEIPGLVKSSW